MNAARREEMPLCLQAALEYFEMGWWPIPLCTHDHSGMGAKHKKECRKPGKAPFVDKWHTRQMDADELRKWWGSNRGYNVGVVMGAKAGLVSFDIDRAEGMELLEQACGGPVPKTLEFVTGSGGRRFMYTWPAGALLPPCKIKSGIEGLICLEVLATGNQTVMPPSVHENKNLYRWCDGHAPIEIDLQPCPPALVRLWERHTAGKRTDQRGGDEAIVSSVPHGFAVTPALIENARAYLRTKPTPDSSADNPMDASTLVFEAATVLVRGFAFPVGFAVSLLQEWDALNPGGPLGSKQYLRKCQDALRHGTMPIGCKRIDPRGSDWANAKPLGPAAVAHRSPGPVADTNSPPPGRSSSPPPAKTIPPSPKRQGRLASQLKQESLSWFVQPWFPRGMLSLIVGKGGTGKSTFLAYLMSKAKRTVLFPGFEEALEIMTLPRLLAHHVDLDNVLILDVGDWQLPNARDRIIAEVREFDADLVLFDPITSYLQDGMSENDGQAVRSMLEGAAQIGTATGAAVIGVRHPGKNAENIMVGSIQWRNVPRSVVELVKDSGPPIQRFLRVEKYSLGDEPAPMYYELVGPPGQPKLFSICQNVLAGDVELAKEVTDRLERWKVMQAEELLLGLLSDGEMETTAIYKAGEAEKLSDRCIRRAAERLNVVHRREGAGKNHKCYWSLPNVEPTPKPEEPPQPDSTLDKGG